MSVKIGIGLGGWPFLRHDPELLWEYVDRAEALGIDSIWLSDRIVSPIVSMEPIVALAFVAARAPKMKIGTSVLALPLRNPTVLAKEIATLDFLSNGRVLPAVGLGTEDEREFEATGSVRSERAGRTDEAIKVMRLLWSEDNVTFHGKYFTLNDVTIRPRPARHPELPPIWIGGRAEPALRRVARVGDGWLVSQATPGEVAEGIVKIKGWLDEYEREIEDDHYGTLFSYCIADSREEAERIAEPYTLRRRTDVKLRELSAFGTARDVVEMLDRFIEPGSSKFVVRPACPPEMMMEQLELLGQEIVPIYHKTQESAHA